MEKLIGAIAPKSAVEFVISFLVVVISASLLHTLTIWAFSPEAGHGSSVHGTGWAEFGLHFFAVLVSIAPFTIFGLWVMYHQHRLQLTLANLAATDLLTGLSNRGDFLNRAAAASVSGTGGALLLVDADHFKRINDTYGHAVGDLCLQAIAERMRKLVRSGDIVGRFGGEEFAVFLPKATPDMARAVGERICEGVRIAVPKEGTEVQITLSVGATPVRAADSIEKMLALADAALYRAKELGRARIEFASIEGRVVF